MDSLPPGELILNPLGPSNGLRAWVSEPFRVFFSLDGGRHSPAQLSDSNEDGVPAYFSDRGRLFQADRGRRIGAAVAALGKRAGTGVNVS